jgi:hypothetical protein
MVDEQSTATPEQHFASRDEAHKTIDRSLEQIHALADLLVSADRNCTLLDDTLETIGGMLVELASAARDARRWVSHKAPASPDLLETFTAADAVERLKQLEAESESLPLEVVLAYLTGNGHEIAKLKDRTAAQDDWRISCTRTELGVRYAYAEQRLLALLRGFAA